MGTRSRIAIRNADSSLDSIYCHSDGYPSYNGRILKDHYTTEDRVRELIALGDLSSLDKSPGLTVAYGRDRGEHDCPAERSADIDALFALTQESDGEWLYVFNGHGWQCAKGGISAFGMPATKAPDGLELIDYWLQREAREARAE